MEKSKLYWACRRGMLELDLFLMPFVEDLYEELTPQEINILADLLKHTDVELYAWLTVKESPENPDLRMMINKIRQHTHDTAKNKRL